MSNTNLVSIIGAGHSGSTLLDLALGGYSKIRSVGKIAHWDRYIHENKECSYDSLPMSCKFWHVLVGWQKYVETSQSDIEITDTRSNTVVNIADRVRYRICLLLTLLIPMYKHRKLIDNLLPEYKQRTTNVVELFDIIRDVSNTPIVCDCSKSPYRFGLLHTKQPETSKAIFLSRDGRAIAAPHYRKFGQSVKDSARRWRFANVYTRYKIRTLPDHSYIHITYEEICREPEDTLK